MCVRVYVCVCARARVWCLFWYPGMVLHLSKRMDLGPFETSALLVRRHTHVLADGEGCRGLDALGEPKLQSVRSTTR